MEIFRVPLTIPMRDGVLLNADLYTDDPDNLDPKPVLLQRTCYDRTMVSYVSAAQALAQRGYRAIVQEARGRNESGGEWLAHEQEAEDGYDTIEWLAAQPFSDGQVGTLGGSYSGWLQLAAEFLRPPSLKAMVVTSSHLQVMQAFGVDRDFRQPRALTWVHKMSHPSMRPIANVDWDRVLRTRPLDNAADELPSSAPMWRRWMAHKELSLSDPVRTGAEVTINVPTLHVSGWEDEPGQSDVYLRAVEGKSQGQFMMVGPWDHPGTRTPVRVTRCRDFGDDAVIDMHEVYATWFDRWLKNDSQVMGDRNRVAVFMSGLNRWVAYERWPPPNSERREFALVANKEGENVLGDVGAASAEPISIRHDPATPVQAFGALEYSDKATDNSLIALEKHDNAVSFTSVPLASDLQVSGNVIVQLKTSSTAATADWVVWLSEVQPDGTDFRITSNGARINYSGDEVKSVTLKLGPISYQFQKGNRVRLYLAGSNFPIWDVLGWHDSSEANPEVTTNTLSSGFLSMDIDQAPFLVSLRENPLSWTT